MKKAWRITLKVLGALLLVLILVGIGGWLYLKSHFVDIEADYVERTDFEEITIEGYTFLDRNANGELDVYEDDREPMDKRIGDILSRMTIEEKIHLLKGSGLASAMGHTEPGEGIPGAAGTIVPTPRLGLPTVYLSDGPAGLRIEPKREGEDRTYYCTAFPIATLLASTWDIELVGEVGEAMGNEALEYGLDVILGPGANIHRHPFCGRNFEYFSEDPLLTGLMGAAMVNGIESNGVGTSVKHFVANNQETNRYLNDAIISERALREIYLKGFEIIVKKAQPWTIMSSYNKLNGEQVAESRDLLTGVLREDWGFEGLVVSDWFGGNDAVAMVNAGNDLLEPGTKKQWKALTKGFENGQLLEDVIDKSVGRILEVVLRSKKMQGYAYGNDPDLQAHAVVTRRSASEGMVLLKNEGVLPLKGSLNVALLGVYSYDFIAGGTGSGDVNEAYTVSLEEGLENAGYTVNAQAKNLYVSHRDANKKDFVKPEGIYAMFQPYLPPEMTYEAAQLDAIASSSDVAVITIGRNSGEGGDRVEQDDFLLSQKEKDMLTATCDAFQKAGKQVVVVLNIGGAIETASWKEQPDAVLLAWQGGQEGGNSAADVLSGKVSPSGKLPMTFPVNVKDHASHGNFPLDGKPMRLLDILSSREEKPEGKKEANVDYTKYEEGIYVGYRHFDKAGLDVSYPFGHGLSYTRFEFGDMELSLAGDTLRLAITVGNVGQRSGKEVVQIYVGKPDSRIDRPKQELKAFAKTRDLAPGETQEITIDIPLNDLRYWDEAASDWKLEKGRYSVLAGTSSREIRSVKEIEI